MEKLVFLTKENNYDLMKHLGGIAYVWIVLSGC